MQLHLRSAVSGSISQIKRFLRAEDGFLVSTEWLFWATVVAICSIGAIVALRYAAREVFVSTAAGIAQEQPYEFHKHGHYGSHEGYRMRTSPHNAHHAFKKLGEKPGKTWETAPQPEGKPKH